MIIPGIMAGGHRRPQGAPTLVAQTLSNDDTGVDVPAHEAGDMLVIIGRQKFAPPSGPPSLQSGFTALHTASPDFGFASTVQWAIDSSNTIATLANPSGYVWCVLVYRAVTGIGASAVRDLEDVGTVAEFPDLTLTATDGTSTLLGIVIPNQQVTVSTPTGMTPVVQHDGSFGGGSFDVFEQAGATEFAGRDCSWSGSAYWVTYSIELLGA